MLKKVRIIKPVQNLTKGMIITPNGLFRDWLIQNGFAILWEDESEERTAELEPKREKAVRKRGRPRKNTTPVKNAGD